MAVRQPLVVDPQEMQHRRVEVVRGRLVRRRLPGPGIALAVGRPAPDAASRHPADERSAVVVPAGRSLRERHPPELRVPQDQRVFQESSLSEVREAARRSDRSVAFAIFGSSVMMSVWLSQLFDGPRAAPDLDEPDAPLDEPPGEETPLAEVRRRRIRRPVEAVHRLRLLREVKRLGGRRCIRAASS